MFVLDGAKIIPSGVLRGWDVRLMVTIWLEDDDDDGGRGGEEDDVDRSGILISLKIIEAQDDNDNLF